MGLYFRLEQSKKKLERLKRDFEEALEDLYSTQKLTNGQPMNDKRNGASWFKKMERKEEKCRKLDREIEAQKEKIEKIEAHIGRVEGGLNRNGSGLKLSVDNLERIKAEINNPKTKYKKETIKKYKEYVESVEKLNSGETPEIIKQLIKTCTLNPWKKYPNIFFITELKRVAIIYMDGKVGVSKKYMPKTEREKAITKDILEHIRRHL